jgi:transcriptional regulator with XRE-family HTH domain
VITNTVPLGRLSPLRYARLARGLSQRELEQLAGLPATVISHLEGGRRTPDPATAARIAMALGVDDVDELFPPT